LETLILLIVVIAALGGGAVAGYFLQQNISSKRNDKARTEATHILEEAEKQQKNIVLQAKEEAFKIRSSSEGELRERRVELGNMDRRLSNREENLEKRSESLEHKRRDISNRETEVETLQAELQETKSKEIALLEQIAEMSSGDAKDLLLRRADDEIQHEVARRYRDVEELAKVEADAKARKIVTLAIHRLAVDVVSESTVTAIPIPSDDMKGRIIGREGRNIRAIEAATGVDLIVDDTPEAVTVSCFDPIRREIAKVALSKLIADGRIHPAKIEEMVEKATREVEEAIWKEGENAVFEAGVRGLNPEIVKLLGRLKYRFSYGENVLKHSIEVSLLAGMIAAEIGASTEIAKAGGLLHDIGKALTHEVEGPHAEIGAEIAKKYGLSSEVHTAIKEHHDTEMSTIEAFLVAASDAISAARPGARKDTAEHYVKRLEALESVANSFEGVEKCYAIQAGREVRIMVAPDNVDDIAASTLARNIVKKIEEQLTYPGQIKVTVIRETRNTEYAR
jgi:ribonuclease Y